MYLRWTGILFVISSFLTFGGMAQVPNDAYTTHHDTLNIFEDQPHSIQPFVLINSETVYVSGVSIDTSKYEIDYRYGHLWLEKDPPGGDATLEVKYQTLPFSFRDVYRRRAVTDSGETVAHEEPYETNQQEEAGGGLSFLHSGSLSRGIRMGSHRDMRVDSGLRMEFSGEVADGVEVRGSLTDEETPIQPDGSTQRLRDVDRVNLQVASQAARVELGDFDLALNGSHFAQLNRRVQGVMLKAEDDFGLGYVPSGSELTVAAVQNRGTYRQQEIQPIDGVQGPYQLRGSNGERFIVVMAGSERVYLDGQLLQRGERQDYTIDYATGEVWFTADHLITDNRRISIEFEYATGEQNRTVMASQARVAPWHDAEGNVRARIGATVLRAADGRGRFADLPAEEALIPGPDGTLLRSGARSVQFDPEAPYSQYRLSTDEDVDSVFVPISQAPSEDEEVYRVRFTHVGEGQGSYVRDDQAVNAIRYKFRGDGQGSYAPLAPMAMPQEHQIVDVHAEVEVFSGVELFGEWAQSDRNQNRLFSDPQHVQQGRAYRGGLRLNQQDISFSGLDLGKLSAEVRRHYQGNQFHTLERTREVEFGRRWNLPGLHAHAGSTSTEIDGEQRDELQVEWSLSPRLRIAGDYGWLNVPGMYESQRQGSEVAVPLGDSGEAQYEFDRIRSEATTEGSTSTWVRHQGGATTNIFSGHVQPGISVQHEERKIGTAQVDSLASSSFRFTDIRPQLGWNVADGWRLGAEVSWRQEDRTHAAKLMPAVSSWTSYATAEIDPASDFRMNARLGYRLRDAMEEFQEYASRTLLMRSHIQHRLLDRAIDINVQHEARTERTPVMQELFLRTGPELGEYVWEDENGDGIMQIDEMMPERTPGEGMYARRMVPTDSLVPVTHVEARLRLHVDPYRLWRNATGGWKRLLSNVESRSTIDLREQTRSLPSARLYLLDPSQLLQAGHTQRGRSRLSQDLIFLRRQSGIDVTLGYNRNETIEDRAAELETTLMQEWMSDIQLRISPEWSTRLRTSIRQDGRASTSYATRTYDLRGWKLRPHVTYQAGTSGRVGAGLHVEQLRDQHEDRSAFRLSVPIEMRLARAGRLQVTAEADLGHIRLEGDPGGLTRFQMTDGRGAGTSARWHLGGRYQLTEMLHMSFNYNGLAAQETPVRNTFQIELTAEF